MALFPDEVQDYDSLFPIADRRLYLAKRAGRNGVVGAGWPAEVMRPSDARG